MVLKLMAYSMTNIHLRTCEFIILILALSIPIAAADTTRGDSARVDVSYTLDGANGSTHIHLGGTQDEMTILFIHGLLFGLRTWDNITEALPADEFRTIRYDLIGQGESSNPDIRYDAVPFLHQLDEVWDFAKIDTSVVIIAGSMGAKIAALKVCERPDGVLAVILVAPAGMQHEYPWRFRLLRTPILAHPIIYLLSLSESSLRNICSDILTPEQQEKLIPELRQRLRKRANRRALISTLHNFPLYDVGDVYKQLSETQIPILVLWGAEDRVVPYPGAQAIYEQLPNAQLELIKDGHHALQCNSPEIVNEKIKKFLRNLN